MSLDLEGLGDNDSPALRRLRHKQEMQMEEDLLHEEGEECVQVCVRNRPFNRRELELQKEAGDPYIRSIIEMPDGMGGKVICLHKDGSEYKVVEEFQFTKSFWSIPEDQQPHAYAPVDQQDVFEAVGLNIIKYALVGFNNCVFAYGQTGSGKTYTMMGDFETEDDQWVGNPGIIPRLCKELFERIERKREFKEEGIMKTYDVQLTAIEIYNEAVRDLFWKSTPGRTKNTILKVRKHPTEGAFVDQITVLEPRNYKHCLRLIDAGVSQRTVAATLMNDESSRSHSVFQIMLTQSETIHIRSDDPAERYSKPITHKKVSRINLIDLAGSERIKKSGAQGQNLKEAAGINQSLSTLKKVIDALVHNSKEVNPKKQIIIPYRESTLTLLLSHSLGGNSKTTMIACVSPHYDNQEETLLTLRYASRTKGIINLTKVNEDNAAKSALQLKHQILALQKMLEDGQDEEAEDLKDQIEVGKLALNKLEADNVKYEKQVEEMRVKTKQEEGARYAAAFYNSLKMVMLQQQKEQMEASAAEMEKRLTEYSSDNEKLRNDMADNDAVARDQMGTLEEMQLEDSSRRIKDMQMEQYTTQLKKDSRSARKHLEREVELRYAQKLVNARQLRISRERNAREVQQLQDELDAKLGDVILQAAEQYEAQVREYADMESARQRRIANAESEIQRFVKQREEKEKECAELSRVILERERQHNQHVDELEAEWKAKYANMKKQYEVQVQEMEETYYEEQRLLDEKLEDEVFQAEHDLIAQINQKESELRTKETIWAGKINRLLVSEAERMNKEIETLAQSNAKEEIAIRKGYEQRIAELVTYCKLLRQLNKETWDTVKCYEEAVAPLIKMHDELSKALPPTASDELRALYRHFAQYTNQYRSTRVRQSDSKKPNGDQPRSYADPYTSTGIQQRSSQLPPVNFYPLFSSGGQQQQQRR